MSNKIIRQQLNILNGEDLKVNNRLQKLKSPLGMISLCYCRSYKIIQNKQEETDILAENLKLLRKKAIVRKESKAAQKKRSIISENIDKENQKIVDKKKLHKKLVIKKKKEKRLRNTLDSAL
ncbi:hypothetical protein CYY_005021 [Polysphondylium violaceum]|uniref:Uncharacterized protein n=1 Tax=Polysphondylium violaceum TaxID=133409 RepID=A0A8J4PUF9_9MYCE|nr:hypothetical protein CYY_005021 [Polysphondylium violaceum]